MPGSFILLPPKQLLSGVRLRELRSGLRLALTCFSSLIWARYMLQRSFRCMVRNSRLIKITDFNCHLNNRGNLVLYLCRIKDVSLKKNVVCFVKYTPIF